VAVPAQMRLVGVDDVKYASLLSVPLTTIHQPCTDIGAMAIAGLLYVMIALLAAVKALHGERLIIPGVSRYANRAER